MLLWGTIHNILCAVTCTVLKRSTTLKILSICEAKPSSWKDKTRRLQECVIRMTALWPKTKCFGTSQKQTVWFQVTIWYYPCRYEAKVEANHGALCIWEVCREWEVFAAAAGLSHLPLTSELTGGRDRSTVTPGPHALSKGPARLCFRTSAEKVPTLYRLLAASRAPGTQPHLAIRCVSRMDTRFNLVVQSIASALSFFLWLMYHFSSLFFPYTNTAMPEVLPLLVEKL